MEKDAQEAGVGKGKFAGYWGGRAFWGRYRWFIIIYLFSLVCDSASTIFVMLKEGVDVETHLAIRFVSKIFGPVIGPLIGLFGKVVASIFVAIYCKRFAIYIFVAVIILSLWAAWYNIWGINVYTPNILKWIPW